MKRIRSLMVLAGLSVAFLVLSSTGARAQGLYITQFAGTFTLPAEAQWGTMTLPAGDYSLYFGRSIAGWPLVEVIGEVKGSPHGLIHAATAYQTSATKNSLICIRDGNSLVVRKLEMPGIGKSADFAMPHGMKLLAHNQKHGQYTLAEAPMLIERVPVTMNGK